MSTLEKTVSMLENMPEEDREQVFLYAQQLFTRYRPANPYTKKDAEAILSDLEESRKQIELGQGRPMISALTEMGNRHGFV
jgi:hypothetical protein